MASWPKWRCSPASSPGRARQRIFPELLGRARTLEVVLGAALFDASLAEAYGWINRAIPDRDLDRFVDDFARRVARLTPGLITAAKAAVDATSQPVLEALKIQKNQLGETFGKPEARNLTRAALKAGAQTREGERRLEDLLNNL